MPEITDDDDESINNLFGKYEIGRLLGVGSSAKVYHGRNLSTGQSVAIKVFNKQKLLKGGHASNIKREIAILRRLRHPHVVKLLEVLATRTKIYLVMEFAKGGELFARIEKGRFSEDLCRRYFQQLISAVGYCHSRGVYHRDLKPENLLLDENWNLKVSDFGLGALTEEVRHDDGLLHTLCGTPAYVAPQVLGKKGYDGAKVDVWSCGVVLFVLNAGYLPFNDRNLMALYKKIYKGEYRCPKWRSPDLKRLLSRLLDVNPETRITVAAIVQDPWFRKGYKQIKFHVEEPDWKTEGTGERLSAFDIISFSPGFDLSGLFRDTGSINERFVSAETLERIMAKVDEVVAEERLTVIKRRGWAVQLAGQNGNLVISVEIFRLTEELMVVEVNLREKNGNGGDNGMWKDRIRPKLWGLEYRTE